MMKRIIDQIGDPETVPLRVEFAQGISINEIDWNDRIAHLYRELSLSLPDQLCGMEIGIVAQSETMVYFHIGWISSDEVDAALSCVERVFPEALVLHVGDGAGPVQNSGLDDIPRYRTDEFVFVPEKQVQFEDGRRETVKPFLIGRCSVTVPQFLAFVEATGYATTAEQYGESDTFRQNPSLECVIKYDPQDAPDLEAMYISKIDALAYCNWSSTRLPTEAEWLAAMVLDWTPLDPQAYEQIFESRTVLSNELRLDAANWTSSHDQETGKSICRSTPQHYLPHNWKERSGPIFHNDDYFDPRVGFRVVKDVVRENEG